MMLFVEQRFADIISRWMSKNKIATDKEGAAALGIRRSVFNRYRRGDMAPSYDRAIELIHLMGGDIERALPWWTPTDESVRLNSLGNLPIHGSVDAGTGDVVIEADACEVHESDEGGGFAGTALADLVRESRMYAHGRGDPFLVRVSGRSMEPNYPNGSLIALRECVAPDNLPKDAEVILLDLTTGETTFKRVAFERGPSGEVTRIIAIPINTHEFSPRTWAVNEVAITHVVVGAIRI